MIHPITGFPTHCLDLPLAEWRKLNEISLIPPPILCRLDKTPSALSDETLDHIKASSRSALLFIHGFNQALGNFGRYPLSYRIQQDCAIQEAQFKDQHEKPRYYIDFNLSPYTRTLRYPLHAPQELLSQFADLPIHLLERYRPEINPEGIGEEEIALNGTAAHHWFSAMEYNFNVASGFNQHNYHDYRRIICVHWPGNVGLLHFSTAEQIAHQKASALASIIIQLVNENLRVEIVAHSLGSRLLLSCMEHLTQAGYTDAIHTAVLWQAAMPNQALTQHADAIKAARKTMILFSQNDGVLQGLYCGHQLPKYPIAALGYSGPKRDSVIDSFIASGKLKLVDQTRILQGHSYLKIPTSHLMNEVYKSLALFR